MKYVIPILVCGAAGTALANPRALPFTYTTDTLPDGQVEIEEYVDLVPQRAFTTAHPGGHGEWVLPSAFYTELEIGIADRLELGLYFTAVPGLNKDLYQQSAQFPGEGTGLKQRLRYIFADPNEWPVDVGVYGEITENERELEFEAKVLLQRRFGDLRIAANLSSEFEVYFSGQHEYVLNPSLGATYEVSPKLHVGLDSFVRGEYQLNMKVEPRPYSLGPELYAGPAIMMNFGKLWWAVGAYKRVTDWSYSVVPGDSLGPLWFRSMIGYDI